MWNVKIIQLSFNEYGLKTIQLIFIYFSANNKGLIIKRSLRLHILKWICCVKWTVVRLTTNEGTAWYVFTFIKLNSTKNEYNAVKNGFFMKNDIHSI